MSKPSSGEVGEARGTGHTRILFLPYSRDFGQTHLTRLLVVRTKAPTGILARLRSEL